MLRNIYWNAAKPSARNVLPDIKKTVNLHFLWPHCGFVLLLHTVRQKVTSLFSLTRVGHRTHQISPITLTNAHSRLKNIGRQIWFDQRTRCHYKTSVGEGTEIYAGDHNVRVVRRRLGPDKVWWPISDTTDF